MDLLQSQSSASVPPDPDATGAPAPDSRAGGQAFLILDREGRARHLNPLALSLLGAGPDHLDRIGRERLRHDLPEAEARAWFQTLGEAGGSRSERGTWLALDGSEVAVDLQAEGTGDGLVYLWARSCPATPDPLEDGSSLQRHLAEGIYALSLARTREEALRVLLGRAAAILPWPHWFVGRLETSGDQARVVLEAETPSMSRRRGHALDGLEIPLVELGFAREVYQYHRMCFVGDVPGSPHMVPAELAKAYRLQSLLGLPLVFEGRIIGVLVGVTFLDEPPVAVAEPLFPVLQTLARIGALALDRIEGEGRLEEAASLARGLAQAIRDLAEATDEQTLVARLFTWAATLAPMPEWWFNRYDPDTHASITIHWTPGIEALATIEDIQRPIPVRGNPFLEDLHYHQKPVSLARCDLRPDLFDLEAWPFRSVVGLPVAYAGNVAGILHGGSFGEQGHVHLPEARMDALQALAEGAGLVLNRLHTRQKLEAEEARFRKLFEQAPDASALLADGVILDVNRSTVALFERSRESLLGLPPTELSPLQQPSGERSFDLARKVLWEINAGLRNRFEWTFLRPSGQELICEIAITTYPLGSQRIYHAVLRDVTGQKRAEAERTALERQLFQAQKMESLGVLAGGIAHDFNNLLMGVLGHAGLALEQLNPLHPARRNLESIQKAGQRAADLTRQMLAYSGRGQFVVRHLDLTSQVEEMLHLLEVSLPKTVVLNLDLRRSLPAVSADASQIQQVIMNLVINAAEAIADASGAITLATGAQRLTEADLQAMLVGQDMAPGVYVFLEVTDTGSGMDSDTMSRIFEPFFTTKFTGRGLGLSAIMGIVRGHKGALRVQSEVGRGTTFRVLLPAQETAAEALASPVGSATFTGQGMILVVDDDETVRAVARQALEMKGFQVLEAHDGRVAVEQVRAEGAAISLVLLDMTMPHMGGEEAFRAMRLLQPELRVILSSGYSEVEAMSRFMGKGLKGFIQKPYGPKELLAKLQSILEP